MYYFDYRFQIGGFVPFAGMCSIEIEAELNDIDLYFS